MTKHELASGRKFRVYGRLMDAATKQKLKDILPWIKPGTIVDVGPGTGSILKAISEKFPSSSFIGVDVSRHFTGLVSRKFRGDPRFRMIGADIVKRPLARNSADTMIFSAVLHEIYSYNHYSVRAVAKALRNAYNSLKPGGRLIIRDGTRPPRRTTLLELSDPLARKMFGKFVKEFKQGAGAVVKEVILNGKSFYRMSLATAYEFLSKKDYLENWELEINEEFGYLTLPAYKNILRKIGFKIVSATNYKNPWIINNRWKGKAALFAGKNGRLKKIEYPDTNLVIAAEKPAKKTA